MSFLLTSAQQKSYTSSITGFQHNGGQLSDAMDLTQGTPAYNNNVQHSQPSSNILFEYLCMDK
jgi:hypothetical protein